MKKAYQLIIGLFLLGSFGIQAQVFVSSEYKQTFTKAEIMNQTGVPVPYDVDLYKIIYKVVYDGDSIVCSGLVGMPQGRDKASIVIYQHGTTDGPVDVPSNLAAGTSEVLTYAAFGFITAATDYIGLGEDTEHFHPYVHADTEAAAGLYMLYASRTFAEAQNVEPTEKLYLAGYSQGGHASMALHKLLEEEHAGTELVTASAHMSGPYDMSGVMREVILSDEPFIYSGYIPYVILSYNSIYGNLYSDLSEVFKAPYIADIEKFQNGNATLRTTTLSMNITLVITSGPTIVPKNMLQDSIVQRLINNDPNDPFIQALKDNDLYNWSPKTPTRLYYCTADDQVSYRNSIVADSVMQSLNATDEAAININPDFDHGQCAFEAIPTSVQFFLGFEEVGVDNLSIWKETSLFPNPVNRQLMVQSDLDIDTYRIFDFQGRLVAQQKFTQSAIDVDHLKQGQYVLQLINEAGLHNMRFNKF